MTGNDILKIRHALKLNQTDFAHKLGYGQQQRVSELECYGSKDIPKQSAWRITALKLDRYLK